VALKQNMVFITIMVMLTAINNKVLKLSRLFYRDQDQDYFVALLGATENARLELSAPSKMQGWKMQDWNYRHQTAGVENAGTSSYGKPIHLRDWKCRSYFLLVTAHTKHTSNYLSDFTK